MPKKRNTSWSRNKKEKQILTARLIGISLKVDDYIYNHKLISVCEAEQYMREVCSYKTQCSQDERSLQVIEKLTRCMKAIIRNNQELRPNIHGENNGSSIADSGDRAGSISPVYSIADEDRTQLTQIGEARPVDVTEANKDVEIIDLSNFDDDDEDLIHNDTNNSTADYAGSKIPVEVEIHRGMSSLSLRDVGAPHIISSDVNCSQSILNNFEGVDQMQQNEINIVSKGAVAGGLVSNVADEGKTINVMQAVSNTTVGKIPNEKTTPIIEPNKIINMKTSIALNKPIILRNTNSNLKYKTVVQHKEPTSVINTANYNVTMTPNQNDNILSSQLPFHLVTNNIPEIHRQTWYDSNRTCTINDSSHKLLDANHFTQPAQIYKVVNPVIVKKVDKFNANIPTNSFNVAEKGKQPIKAAENSIALTNNIAIVQDDSTTIKKKRGPRKKKTLDEKEAKPKNKRVYNRAPKSNKENTFTESAKDKIIPIYNENVINDLSWVENIRYVREIKVDENDPNLNLDETFWDNYYLPANWSENEF